MEFTRYDVIENVCRKKFIQKAIELKFDDCNFVVQEKIHGSNFGIYLRQLKNHGNNESTINDDNLDIKYASRNKFIPDNDSFYNYKIVTTKYHNNFKQVFKEIQKSTKLENLLVIVYGELYGGGYMHKDVKSVPECVKIQKEVQYCPHIDFIAFDIRVNGIYLPVNEANSILEKCDVPYCETLFSGSLEDCLKYSNVFDSTIPIKHNLPPIENNICEGTVIKPLEPKFFDNGYRFILKNKNVKFKETKVKNTQPNKDKKMSEIAQNKLTDLLSHVTESRLNNVISKLTDSEKEKRNILQDMFRDVHEESQKSEGISIDFKKLDKWEQKKLNKTLYEAINLLYETSMDV